MIVLEVGLLLDENLEYYQEILKKVNAENVFNCVTRDVYLTNVPEADMLKMTENEIKRTSVRIRNSKGFSGSKLELKKSKKEKHNFQNFKIFDSKKDNSFKCGLWQKNRIIKKMISKGWRLWLDTIKTDYQYKIGDMKSAIQLQDIKDIGLVLYYDNPDYYEFDEDEQRLMLINELNGYGFNISKDELGIDKLRTFVHKKPMYSKNQNG